VTSGICEEKILTRLYAAIKVKINAGRRQQPSRLAGNLKKNKIGPKISKPKKFEKARLSQVMLAETKRERQ